VKFEDYYAVLEVPRTAAAEDIKKSYRRLSKLYHPDINKQKGAEDKFKRVSEAYEVLKDPEKRRRYDALGSNYKAGQDFRPPPGYGGAGGQWSQFDWNFGGGGTRGETPSQFSDFFEAFFRQQQQQQQQQQQGRRRRGEGSGNTPRDGASTDADITIDLIDAYLGAVKPFTLQHVVVGPDGGRRTEERTYNVRIPPGTIEGTKIRLKGEGAQGIGGGAPGDLLLRVHLANNDRFVADGHDLHTHVRIAPWEAVLGGKVQVPTLDGAVTLTLPPGSQGGQKLRVKGKGLPLKDGERGNLIAELMIVVPTDIDEDTKAWLAQWRARSNFDPRQS
jgi:curved DNA-binding protein